MKISIQATVFCVLTSLAAGPVLAELYVYPAKGQSSEQTDKDKFECYNWAKNDTGFDPMAVPRTTTAPPSGQKKSGGAVKGALGGAALGAIFGSSSKNTRNAALAGGAVGGVRQSSQNAKTEQKQQQWEQQETANYANNRNNYNRAYSACLEGRGYSVK